MPNLLTFSLVTVEGRLGDLSSDTQGGIQRFASLESPAIGLTNAFCACQSCCDLYCELNLGSIAFASAEYGGFSFSNSASPWINSATDVPASGTYKAWLRRQTVDGRCKDTVEVYFGSNAVSYPIGHDSYPGSFAYGPTALAVDSDGIAIVNFSRSGSGGPVGDATRPGSLKGVATGVYSGTNEIPNPDGSIGTTMDNVTLTIGSQSSQICLVEPTLPSGHWAS